MRELPCGLKLEDGPVLLTGAGGFVGRYLMEHLAMGRGDYATDLTTEFEAPQGVRKLVWRLPEPASREIGPVRYVVHLAAMSSVSRSLKDIQGAYSTNLMGTISVLEMVANENPGARLLLVSSAEVYRSQEGLLEEDSEIAPINPYGATKAAAEAAARQYSRARGIDCVVSRSFPHFGPGQSGNFALPSFCRRIAEARRSGGGTIRVGNLSPVRDYLYVEDVVRAYCSILAGGSRNGVYNVCSGQGRSMGEMVETLVRITDANVTIEVDPKLVRPVDTECQVGDPSRLRESLGWKQRVTLEEGLEKLYRWWEERI